MKKYNPRTKSRRHMTDINRKKFFTVSKPEKSLTKGGKRMVGRNNRGRITSIAKGGGHKRRFRLIDFKYNKKDVPARVVSVEYDPNRTAFIGVLSYRDGEKRYSILPQGIEVGSEIMVSEKAEIKVGNRLALKNIPIGAFVFAIELKSEGGAKLVRSAGSMAEILAQDGNYTQIKMPSSEVRKIHHSCFASIGAVSNEENRLVNLGKAGRSRWLGIRPRVRGSAKNPVDHPYGGGEGRQGRGRRRAITRTGRPVGKGQKSRRPKKYSNKLIISRRQIKRRK